MPCGVASFFHPIHLQEPGLDAPHAPVSPQVWQLRGRYPNRGYPKIFNDATVGVEAKKLFDEAQAMLVEFVKHKHVRLNGLVGFYPANAVGDDIEVYTDESRTQARANYHVQLLRYSDSYA